MRACTRITQYDRKRYVRYFVGDRVTGGDNPIEYEETTETFEGGTRTTRTPKMSDSKGSQDANPSEDLPKNMAAAGEWLTKHSVKSSTHESSQEEDEDSHK